MEEKVLVKSTSYNARKIACIILVSILVITMILVCVLFMKDGQPLMDSYNNHRHYKDDIARKYGEWLYDCYNKQGTKLTCSYSECNSAFSYALKYNYAFKFDILPWLLGVGIGVNFAICLVLYFWLRSYEITVTDKRVYGRCAFGKRVDLPNDSISATSMVPLLKGVAVATSSGKISFLLIKNANEVYEVLNKQLMERQDKKAVATAPVVTVSNQSNADELKKYKDLLDAGIITQEEFDAKKKQLLGL